MGACAFVLDERGQQCVRDIWRGRCAPFFNIFVLFVFETRNTESRFPSHFSSHMRSPLPPPSLKLPPRCWRRATQHLSAANLPRRQEPVSPSEDINLRHFAGSRQEESARQITAGARAEGQIRMNAGSIEISPRAKPEPSNMEPFPTHFHQNSFVHGSEKGFDQISTHQISTHPIQVFRDERPGDGGGSFPPNFPSGVEASAIVKFERWPVPDPPSTLTPRAEETNIAGPPTMHVDDRDPSTPQPAWLAQAINGYPASADCSELDPFHSDWAFWPKDR